MGEGHRASTVSIIFHFLSRLFGYIQFYCIILYILHYYEIFPKNLKIRGKKEWFSHFWDIAGESLSIVFLLTQFPLVLNIGW